MPSEILMTHVSGDPAEPAPRLNGPRRLLNRLGGKRAWFYVLAGLGAGLAAMIGGARWTLSDKALIDEVAAQVYASSGLYVAAKARPSFSLLPRPHVAIEGVALADPGGFLTMDADRLDANVRLMSLMAGRLQIDRLTLARPRIGIDRQKSATPGQAFAQALAAVNRRPSDKAGFGVVTLVNGAVTFHGEKTPNIEKLNANLEWLGFATPATLTGDFDWRGEHWRGLLWIARPGALRLGDQTPLTLRLDSALLQLEAEGIIQSGAMPRYNAHVVASAPSMRAVLGLLDMTPPLPGPLENFELAAQASVGPSDMQLSQLRFLADNNEFAGAFSLRKEDERTRIQASLTSTYVTLKPLLDNLPSLSTSDGQWSRENFDLPDLSTTDVDLRLSTAHLRLSRLSMDDAELVFGLRAGRLDIALTQAKAYKGSLKAHATLAPGPQSAVEMHLEAQTSGIDAGSLLWDAIAHDDISGSLDSALALNASGESMAAMMRALDGRASFTLAQGAIAGIDLERALSRVDKRPLSSAMYIRSGRSSLEKASAKFRIANGVANVEDGAASGPGFSLAFTGSARVLDRSLALRAQVFPADEAGAPRARGQQLGFDLTGAWDDLNFAPDAKALIRRSGAAAPLLPPAAAPDSAARDH
ncbi:MAG: AsmA family protein [Methylocystis sp.]